ncbi:hypothetical protein CQW23_06973 [Capsicum baccatum]|uniref:Uncharacterized protein n=1 Tax=Capsicum baccatum TaxID=33114 RepID=A0A2G2X4W7_CAPBA|nr:hypothetical protein CQW23_06973 [Capsicum baccatum]
MEAEQLIGTVVVILAGEDGERGLDGGGSGADGGEARLFVIDDGKDNFEWFGGSEGWSDGAPTTGVPRGAGEGRWWRGDNFILREKMERGGGRERGEWEVDDLVYETRNSILLIKVLQKPKIVDKVLQEPNIGDKVLQEPNIMDKFLQEPNIVDKVLQEPNIVNKVLQKPKIVDKVLQDPNIVDKVL